MAKSIGINDFQVTTFKNDLLNLWHLKNLKDTPENLGFVSPDVLLNIHDLEK